MKIGEVSQRTGVPTPLLRYYEKRGLLGPERSPNGFRSYSPASIERVATIRRLLDHGLSTVEIRELLPYLDGRAEPDLSAENCAMLGELVTDLDQRIAGLSSVRDSIARHLAAQLPVTATG
jgi:DNA-binding transcriptional MerR regulator